MKVKDNKGFSLIEIIITLALMGIITTISMSLYGSLSNSKVKSATTELNDQLSNVRTNTMSKKGAWSLTVSNDNGKYYATIYRDMGSEVLTYEEIVLGSESDISIKVEKMTELASGSYNTMWTELSNGTSVTMMYNSGSGACMKNVDYYVTGFEITNSKLTKKIVIAKSTGKHYIE